MLDINLKRCNGCQNLEEGSHCVSVCPGDLLYLNEDNQAEIIAPNECWDCFACVKECPRMALSITLPFQINEGMATLNSRVAKTQTVWELRTPESKLIERLRVPSKQPEPTPMAAAV